MLSYVAVSFSLANLAWAAPQPLADAVNGSPAVTLDYATFRGTNNFLGVNSFLGMPFAKAGRLENPVVYNSSDKLAGVQDATKYGKACPQQEATATQFSSGNSQANAVLAAIEQVAFGPISNQGEDCLTINVQMPANVSSTDNLPVLMWIFGGGFQLGSSASLGAELTAIQGLIYQGARLVQRSIEMGQPIIFVSANYRLNAFGTLASQEITDANVSNLMLKDQREAMRWVQKYIGQFGGDKSKVTIFGESAGSVSVATQMVLNGGDNEGLFRAAIMASGGILKLQDYHRGQETFDFIAQKSGCGAATDKIACLRTADYNLIYNAVQQVPNFFSYTGLAVPWEVRPDGKFLPASPHTLLRQGKIANVPYIIGDMKDEGTIFSLTPQSNMTTDQDFQAFWRTNYFPQLSGAQVKAFTDLYSQDPAQGSPFDTGDLNAIGPQHKRLAAAQGDYMFQSGRRDLLNYTYATQPAYTYLIEQSAYIIGQLAPFASLTGFPLVGSFHASDVILNDFGLIPAAISKNTLNLMSTYISFVNTLDPNNHGLKDLPHWPTWDPQRKAMFKYNESGCSIIRDDYREEQMGFVNENADVYVS
ncbi:hypothetical protein PRZ48_012733 [Zasmidium cellare]|uniref:Carboxylic ester hydrolase n=1 Tax=Zasmidium cellare TaxID=395010 RepID=A0ABR0E682_ZASCE|nr:hypothetical protein PRZ48_012733 [Zasmidium cellare]